MKKAIVRGFLYVCNEGQPHEYYCTYQQSGLSCVYMRLVMPLNFEVDVPEDGALTPIKVLPADAAPNDRFERMAATMTAQSIRIDDLLDFVRAYEHQATKYDSGVVVVYDEDGVMLHRAEELIAKHGVAK